MIIVPRKNLYLPERVWGRKEFQRGIIHLCAAFGGRVPPTWLVTLSGESFGSSGAGQQEARLEVRVLGNMFTFTTDAGIFQIDSGTDWIIPNGDASSAFDVRYTNLGGDPLDTAPAAEDAWVAMSTTRLYGYIDNTSSPGVLKSGSFDIQIRWNDGSPLDTGTYTITANRTS